jgi:hypothetical protein
MAIWFYVLRPCRVVPLGDPTPSDRCCQIACMSSREGLAVVALVLLLSFFFVCLLRLMYCRCFGSHGFTSTCEVSFRLTCCGGSVRIERSDFSLHSLVARPPDPPYVFCSSLLRRRCIPFHSNLYRFLRIATHSVCFIVGPPGA